MGDAIEIMIWRQPGGSMSANRRVVATATLHRIDGGHGIYARVNGAQAWERRGFIAGGAHEELWRLVAKAATWAAQEAEKQ